MSNELPCLKGEESFQRLHWVAYTDGGSKNNVGGFGIHAYLHDASKTEEKIHKAPTRQGYLKESSPLVTPITYIDVKGGDPKATNNVMEIMAIHLTIQMALVNEAQTLLILTDSSYALNAYTDWVNKWEESNWTRPDGQPVKNKELWIEAIAAYRELKKTCKVKLVKVAGHSGDYGNDRADSLATEGRLSNPTAFTYEIYYKQDSKSDHAEEIKEKITESMHPIFSKAYLYATTNLTHEQRVSNDGRYPYYMGRHTGKKNKVVTDPDIFLGKPSAEHNYSIALFKEPEPVIEHIVSTLAEQRAEIGERGTELAVLELARLKRAPVYKRHFSQKGLLLDFSDQKRLITHDGIEIARIAKPMMTAYRLIDYFNSLEWMLLNYTEASQVITIDITDDLYDAIEEKKDKVVYKVKPEMKPGWKGKAYPVECQLGGKTKKGRVKILADIDLPDRNTLAKIAGPETRVKILLYPEGHDAMRYACVVHSPEMDAIYSSLHSNRIFLKE